MAQFIRLNGNTVAEVVTLPDDVSIADAFHPDLGFKPYAGEVQVGWIKKGSGYSAPDNDPAPAPPVPAQVTRRQFAKQMRVAGMITGAESVAMIATGTPPAMIEALLVKLPGDAQISAREDFAADTYLRNDPTMVALLTAAGFSAAEADTFFIEAAKL